MVVGSLYVHVSYGALDRSLYIG